MTDAQTRDRPTETAGFFSIDSTTGQPIGEAFAVHDAADVAAA